MANTYSSNWIRTTPQLKAKEAKRISEELVKKLEKKKTVTVIIAEKKTMVELSEDKYNELTNGLSKEDAYKAILKHFFDDKAKRNLKNQLSS